MNHFSDIYILSYLRGELSEEEMRKCEELKVSSIAFRRKVEELKAICDISDNLRAQREINTAKAWRNVSRKMVLDTFTIKSWNYFRTAAAIILPLFLFYQYVLVPRFISSDNNEMITLSSAPGIITKTSLPDGSVVWLNAQSQLIYPARFHGDERVVKVLGEAYFKVSADRKKRFDVILPDGARVSAFGTEFNINAYADDPDYQITLASGNVEVKGASRSSKPVALEAGQKVILKKQTGEMDLLNADTYVETAWKDGKLVLRREKLTTFARKLSRKFGVEIRLEGEELQHYEYTATFVGETLEDILYLLQRSAPVEYTISDQKSKDGDTFSPRVVTIRSR